MTTFDSDWLTLREAYDHAARNTKVLERVGLWAQAYDRLQVVDLGAGTGSTLRAVAPVLGSGQSWRLIEHDPSLIEAGEARLADTACTWRYERLNLRDDLEAAIDDAQIVTASALVDLVSAEWLEELAALVDRRNCALYVALSYDGRMRWRPGDPFDVEIKSLFDRHQQNDKGIGSPALGPGAARTLEAHFGDAGVIGRSDWRLRPIDRPIQTALLRGHASAASEIAADRSREIEDWRIRRQLWIDTGRSMALVGHRDFLKLPG
ncbi:MAG: hypothetical protein KDE35_12350 [Geminicoccaceae bacterium]|nr:hypothetical protein [Geminicoccaceae bacterium]